MICQKDLFQLPSDIHYLNGAYMSPLPSPVEEAGIRGMQRKRNPTGITVADYFTETSLAKSLFSKLINASADDCAIIPAASYGLGNAIRNISPSRGNGLVLVQQEFPSDYYPAEQWCRDHQKKLIIVDPPASHERKAELWTEKILDSISRETAAVIMSSIHWTDGTRFDLKAIGEKCKEHDALFIVDGTQSVGALPIDVKEFHIDALICAGYKWLLAPYSVGIAYYGPAFAAGFPMELSWLNRISANGSKAITDYTDEFRAGSARYDVGESCNYTLVPMLVEGLKLVTEWGPENIQAYSRNLATGLSEFLTEKGFLLAEEKFRCNHLFGMLVPQSMSRDGLLKKLADANVIVSPRGNGIRVSIHVYNDQADIDALIESIEQVIP